jgi:hypothetical protein
MDVHYKGYENEHHIYVIKYKSGFYKLEYVHGEAVDEINVSETDKYILNGHERENNKSVGFFLTQVEKAIKKFIRNKRLNNILDTDG